MEQTQDCNQGTKGYMAPEWFKNLAITVKADVYSFGILLLEIICCRKKFDEEAEDENKMILADWHMIAINRRKCIFRCRMMVRQWKGDGEVWDDCNTVYQGGSITKTHHEEGYIDA
ncbi:hypothetical protein L3X38_030336 [Prunus dulcis]|uniref:Protein kinase domain-containing protein n=1 Tax=Prunus dulcis TaxID=3755 RepID=A0AAD4YTW8_PRUDU|nr:hypothetical protein L3X38_030336 [Prunus dulcis]